MSRRSGFITRFVDVVLILLFSFISISNIQQSDITLPSSSEGVHLPPDTNEIVYVHIQSNGTFLVEQDREIPDLDGLRTFLSNSVFQETTGSRAVHIRAMFDAPMHSVRNAIVICTELGLPSSLAVRLAETNE